MRLRFALMTAHFLVVNSKRFNTFLNCKFKLIEVITFTWINRANISKNLNGHCNLTSYFLQKVKCCEVGISKFRDNEFVFKSLWVHEVSVREDLVDCVGRLRTNCHWLSKQGRKTHKLSTNFSWLWWILPFTNKVELDIIRHLPNTDEQTGASAGNEGRTVCRWPYDHKSSKLFRHIEIFKSRILLLFNSNTQVAQLQLQD